MYKDNLILTMQAASQTGKKYMLSSTCSAQIENFGLNILVHVQRKGTTEPKFLTHLAQMDNWTKDFGTIVLEPKAT